MKKALFIFLILFITHYTLYITQVFAKDAPVEDARQQAEEIHKRASSDAIYADDELKALYYQNVQIIDLLKEIRELLKLQIELERSRER